MKINISWVLILIFIFCGVTSVLGQKSTYFKMPPGVASNDYIKNTVIFKIKPGFTSYCKNDQFDLPGLNAVFQQLGVSRLQKKFPGIRPPEKMYNSCGQKYADLSLIYEITYYSQIDLETVVNSIIATGFVEYAQPHYISKPLDYTPNDPLIVNQYHLNNIQAFSAWETMKGDTNVVIGISDWGTDFTHPDLLGNLKINHNDPIDGIDNDNDGYTDNYWGWDLGENDNNPIGTTTHGTFVAGLSSALPDNNLGIAGTGFNCKFLPIKVCNADNEGIMTYESIVFAVEHGCSIVNCSWGSTFYTGQYGQDVIDYATINRNALVIAACGNDNNAVPFFPASYNNVLSVAMSNVYDYKAPASNYGHFVDITAPGENVWSTEAGGAYNAYSGTSYSAPITSGCAALLKSRYPSLTGLQIGERLKVSADIIDTIAANIPYKDLLGSGRLNIFKAMNDSTHPSVQMFNIDCKNSHNKLSADPDDTLYITSDFINYLAPTTANCKVTLSCPSVHVSFIDTVFHAGIINTLGTKNNNSSPFRLAVKSTIPVNDTLILKFTFKDNGYRAVQYYYVYANKNYIDIDTNRIATTLTSEGVLGYMNGNSLQGLGFRYNHGETMLYSGGFILGKSGTQVSDVLYNDIGGFDHDFKVIAPLKKIVPATTADVEIRGCFDDSYAGTSKINVQVTQHAYAWASPPFDKFVILEYTILNKNIFPLSGLYAGLYADWDIGISTSNRIEYDAGSKTEYCFSPFGGDYTGIALLSEGAPFHYAFDNDGANGSIKITDGFTGNEKFVALQTNRNVAGLSNQGNDVSGMISTGPLAIGVADSVKIVFALIAGDHLGDLLASADASNQIYNHTGVPTTENQTGGAVLFQNQPNPFTGNTRISFYLDKTSQVEVSCLDILGSYSEIIFKGSLEEGLHTFEPATNLKPGIYIYTLSGDGFCLKKKMMAVK